MCDSRRSPQAFDTECAGAKREVAILLPAGISDPPGKLLASESVRSEVIDTPDLHKLPEVETAKRALVRILVDSAWDTGPLPQSFTIEHEGAAWEVEVRVKQTEDAPLEEDFTDQLPE